VRVRLHPEARDELRSGALWYEEQREGLGDDFVAEVNATLDRIAGAPQSVPLWPGATATAVPIRKAMVHRFPYAMAFEEDADVILVLAVAHARRRPLYWLARAGHDPS